MAEGQVLGDAIDIGLVHQLGGAQTAAALGVFGLQKMPFARARAHDFASASDSEPFGHCFPSFDAFRTSHNI